MLRSLSVASVNDLRGHQRVEDSAQTQRGDCAQSAHNNQVLLRALHNNWRLLPSSQNPHEAGSCDMGSGPKTQFLKLPIPFAMCVTGAVAEGTRVPAQQSGMHVRMHDGASQCVHREADLRAAGGGRAAVAGRAPRQACPAAPVGHFGRT